MTSATRAEFTAAEEPTGPAPSSIWQVLRGPRADPLALDPHRARAWGRRALSPRLEPALVRLHRGRCQALAEEAAVVGQAWDTLNTQLAERAARMWLLPPVLPTRYDRDFRRARKVVNAVVASIIAATANRRTHPAAIPSANTSPTAPPSFANRRNRSPSSAIRSERSRRSESPRPRRNRFAAL